MAKTVIGLFDTYAEAQSVLQDLIDNGFRREDISLVANDTRGEFSREVGGETHGNSSAEGAGAGAVGGTVVGGLLGLLVGAGLLTIPGIGPVLAAGPLAAAIGTTAATVGATALGAGIGAAAGGLVGALVGAGVPEEHANYYAEGVRRGGTLVTVSTTDDMSDRAYNIMRRHGAVDIDERGAQWRESGWTRFDPASEPYRHDRDLDREQHLRSVDDDDLGDEWKESSKVGTGAGTVAGIGTGAAMGAAGGPIGAVVGGVAGGIAGAGVGAAGDVAGEKAEDSREGEGRPMGVTRRTESGRGTIDADYSNYDSDFRSHYQTNYVTGNYTYEQYSPIYRYGYDLGRDDRYAGRDWASLEPEIRRQWQDRNPGIHWDDFKDAVRYSWEKARGNR